MALMKPPDCAQPDDDTACYPIPILPPPPQAQQQRQHLHQTPTLPQHYFTQQSDADDKVIAELKAELVTMEKDAITRAKEMLALEGMIRVEERREGEERLTHAHGLASLIEDTRTLEQEEEELSKLVEEKQKK